MKKFIKKTVVALVITAICLGASTTDVSAKKKVPKYAFGGEYILKKKDGEVWKISISEFSSPEGKEVGSMDIYYKADSKDKLTLTGFTGYAVKKSQKKNVYTCTYMKICVYKKKIKVTGDEKDGCNGTYRLKKRYVS